MEETEESGQVRLLPGYQTHTVEGATFHFTGEVLTLTAVSAEDLANLANYFFAISPKLRDFLGIQLEDVPKKKRGKK